MDNLINRTYDIYFITTLEEPGPVKIGLSINPEKRFKTIQNCSPVKLKLLGTIKGDDVLEYLLHKRFERFRLHGEWFAHDIVWIVEEIIRNPERALQ